MPANGLELDALDCKGRGVFIHRVLALASRPLGPSEIGEMAESLARLARYSELRERTFSPPSVRQHLIFMADHGHAEQIARGKWQLTELARSKFAKP